AHNRRVLPPARRLPRLPVRRGHHGPAPQPANDPRRPVPDRTGQALRPHRAGPLSRRERVGVRVERLDRFMARANAAYYANHDPFRDFTTAPEITQVFGELLGAWAAIVWETMGRPDPVLLAECGPGRGTLMADALRVIARTAPAFRAALDLHLVETSP